MKFVLIHRDDDDGDVLLRMGSEFPPINVSKWLPGSGATVPVRYGRARLRAGFAYFYSPSAPDEDSRVASAEPLVRGLGAQGVIVPGSLGEARQAHMLEVVERNGIVMVALAAVPGRDSLVKRVDDHRSGGRTPRFTFSAEFDDRAQVLSGLWDLYREIEALP